MKIMKIFIGKFLKKTMVRCSDYELYRIFLPWKYIFFRDRNFIVGELEKLHPRFSLSCCYDTKYCIEKKNLLAEVVVMEKASLARYKNCGGLLYLEKQNKRSVFSWSTKITRFASLFLVLAAGFFSFRIASSLLEKAPPLSTAESHLTEELLGREENLLENGIEKTVLPEDEVLLSSVFSSLSSHGGKISSFTYNRADSIPGRRGGLCTFSVYGCNCEDVANARYCVVSFKDNEPHFDMVLPFKSEPIVDIPLKENRKTAEEETASVVAIRKGLRNLGAVFESEHNGDDEAEFSFFAARSILYSCLKLAGLEAENASWTEKSLSVSEKGGMCKVKLSFLKNKESPAFRPLLFAAQYAYLFGSELKIEPKKTSLFKIENEQPGGLLPLKNKIGEIKKKDGSILICYRADDGKMSFEKKEAANANW